MKRAVKNLKAA